jgi:magnesium-transporting ATPase (P-type)
MWVRYSVWKLVLYYLSMLASGGILFVVSVNKPKLKKQLTTSECDPSEATMVFDGENFADISRATLPDKDGGNVIVFEMVSTRYYASSRDHFKTVQKVPDEPANFSDAYVCGQGDRLSREAILSLYGLNRLTLQAADPFNIVMLEVLSPFYIFQYFAVAVWIYTFYYIYSAVVMFITILSIYFVSSDKLFNLKRLHDLADTKGKVDITDRQGSKVLSADVSDSQILPGDCFFVKEGMSLPCDAILISGRVVVDEALLTGESIPITKTQFVKSVSDTDATKRTANILYCGTTVKSIGHAASNG